MYNHTHNTHTTHTQHTQNTQHTHTTHTTHTQTRRYFDVVSEVEPKRQELAAANAKLEEANVTLTEVQAKVAELNAKVQELEAQFKVRDCDGVLVRVSVRVFVRAHLCVCTRSTCVVARLAKV